MAYEITGTIEQIGEVKTFPSGFSKREIVINTGGEYPQHIKLELHKDKTALADRRQVGEDVTVKFHLNGNEYNGKYYNNLVAFAIAGESAADVAPEPDGYDTGAVDDGQDNLGF